MFQLHDKTRRRMCLAAFVLAGVMPSLLVGGWCVDRHLPGCARPKPTRSAGNWGSSSSSKRVQHLRPGVVLYEGIELADPETGQTILRSRCLEVAWQQQTDGQGQRRPTLCVIASQPEIETAAIDLAWRWMQRLLENPPGRCDANVQFSADEVTLRAGDRSQTMTDVAALLETAARAERSAQIDFRLAGADAPEPASIRMVRNREVSPPASRFELSTGDGELPCSVLALAIGELKPLGAAMPFSRAGLGQRNAGRLGRRSRRPTGRIGPRQPRDRSFSAPPERHRQGDDHVGPLSPRTAGRVLRSPRGRARHDRPFAVGRRRRSLGPRSRRRAASARRSHSPIRSWRCRSCSTPAVCGSAASARPPSRARS